MEDDVVRRRRWLTRAHFMDMLAATQLVPGPNSTEMAIHIGYVQQGLPGLIVAGIWHWRAGRAANPSSGGRL